MRRDFANPALVWTLAGGVLAFLYLPLLVMAFFSFNESPHTSQPFTGFTLHWYEKLLQDQQMLRSIANSIYVALGVVFLSTLFGLPAAIALDRSDFPGKAPFRRIVRLPIVLPGVITGVSLLLFYVRIGIPLSLNTIILGQGTGLMCITITEVPVSLTSKACRICRRCDWRPGSLVSRFASWIGSGATALRTRFARARS